MANLITPTAILSYPWLFKPQAAMKGATDQTPKYSCTLVFPKGTDLTKLNEAALEAAREKWGDKGAEIFRKQKNPVFRTDDEKGYPEGAVFMRVSSKDKPGVVSRYKGSDGKPVAITDPVEMWAGCLVRASVRAFAYDTNGNRGVSFGLQNVQRMGDGDKRLDGRKAAADEFDGEEPPAADDMI